MLVTGFPAGPLAANCYVAARAAGGPCVVVDPGQDALGDLRALLRRHRLTPAAVLLTHGHPDHTWAAAQACAEFDVPAYVHPDDRPMLTDPAGWLPPDLAAVLLAERAHWAEPGRVRVPGDGERLALAGLEITAVHAAGHTAGSVTYRVEYEPGGGAELPGGFGEAPEIVFAGDLLFAGSIGRTDLPGGDHEAMLASLADHVYGLDERVAVLPGHGPATTVGRERATNPYLPAARPANRPATGPANRPATGPATRPGAGR